MEKVLEVTETNTSVSLASSAMLATFNASAWAGEKTDKSASERITSEAGARSDSIRSYKSLIKCAELEKVSQIRGEARNHVHYRYALPWIDKGPRLLPNELYPKYVKEMSGKINEFNIAVEAFLDRYVEIIGEQRYRLNELFDEADYPSVDEVRAKFKLQVEYMPIPEAQQFNDFRLKTGVDVPALQAEYEAACARKIQGAMDSVFHRLREPLINMVEKLSYDINDKERKRFNDTLVTNVTGLIDVMRACNLSGNTQMSAIANKLDDALKGVSAESLRHSAVQRDDTVKAMRGVIKTLGW